MKGLIFCGRTLEVLRALPDRAKRDVGYQLDRVQHGLEPNDWKPMTNIGPGVREIRIDSEGEYRMVYVAKFADATHVLHAFRKMTRKTSPPDIRTAKRALADVLKGQES